MKATQTSVRKQEHIRICLEKDVEFKRSNGFERYEFEHCALPEISLKEISASTTFLGRRFELPFFIEPLTGGSPGTEKINCNLARAAETLGIGMGVGSQRAMLEDPGLAYTYKVREAAPNIVLFGNIGASELPRYDETEIVGMVKEIGADGLVIHLNAAQEACQPEGNTDWTLTLANIERVCRNESFPVMVKETGCGIAGNIANMLQSAGVSGLDIAGAGGTSMTKMEYHRGGKIGEAFFEWGIPTAESLRQCRDAVSIPLIASGGIRTGLECAKALAMGASLVGFALPLLRPAMKSHEAVIKKIREFEVVLRRTMLLVGTRSIQKLQETKIMRTI